MTFADRHDATNHAVQSLSTKIIEPLKMIGLAAVLIIPQLAWFAFLGWVAWRIIASFVH